jgi:hypothetical protein
MLVAAFCTSVSREAIASASRGQKLMYSRERLTRKTSENSPHPQTSLFPKARPVTQPVPQAKVTSSDIQTQLRWAAHLREKMKGIKVSSDRPAIESQMGFRKASAHTAPSASGEREAEIAMKPDISSVRTLQPKSEAESLIQRGMLSDLGNLISHGAQAVEEEIVSGAKAIGKGAQVVGGKISSLFKAGVYNGDFQDLNASMYRITTGGKIQRVARKIREDGKPYYVATHNVDIDQISEDEPPKLTELTPQEDLKDWYPQVTHINGMQVKPKDGINSARGLQKLLEANGMKNPDVLYTYSSTQGLLTDLAECIAGKLSLGDPETESQETLMWDAIKNQHRTTISAHSRGTIKTDNAVRNVHKRLSKEYFSSAANSEEAKQAEAAAINEYLESSVYGEPGCLSPSYIGKIAHEAKAQEIADRLASEEMNKYIHLIYAGNAVEFPSTVLKGDLYVAPGNWYSLWNMDYISFLVGSNFEFAQKLKGTQNMTLHRLKPEEVGRNEKGESEVGGHNFDKHYAGAVAKNIAEDMKKQER